MKATNLVFVFFYVPVFFLSCDSVVKNKSILKISLVCLKEIDTLYVKITNNTDSTIYIPKSYDPDFTGNDDTLHLETINMLRYNTTYYYKYKNIFPFEFYSTRKIEGYVPDSTKKHTKQTFYFNQFRVQQILPILPDSSYIMRLEFNVPQYANVVRAVFYRKPFLNKERLDRIDYSIEDFMKFDSLNAQYVITPVIIKYN